MGSGTLTSGSCCLIPQVWRAALNCLPIRVRLREKGIECPSTCVHCNGELENSFHTFLTCPSIIHVILHVGSFKVVIFSLLRSLNGNDSAKFGTIFVEHLEEQKCQVMGGQRFTSKASNIRLLHFYKKNVRDIQMYLRQPNVWRVNNLFPSNYRNVIELNASLLSPTS